MANLTRKSFIGQALAAPGFAALPGAFLSAAPSRRGEERRDELTAKWDEATKQVVQGQPTASQTLRAFASAWSEYVLPLPLRSR